MEFGRFSGPDDSDKVAHIFGRFERASFAQHHRLNTVEDVLTSARFDDRKTDDGVRIRLFTLHFAHHLASIDPHQLEESSLRIVCLQRIIDLCIHALSLVLRNGSTIAARGIMHDQCQGKQEFLISDTC